jgi:hypothetical protein
MVTAVDLLGLAVIVLVHTAVAALLTRFFRVRLHTRLGSAVYTALLGPFVLLVGTLLFGGVLRLGPNLGSPGLVLAFTVLVPMSLGVAFDYFWMPAPADLDLPAGGEDRGRRTRRFRKD